MEKKRSGSCGMSRTRLYCLIGVWVVTILATGLLAGLLTRRHYENNSNTAEQIGGSPTSTQKTTLTSVETTTAANTPEATTDVQTTTTTAANTPEVTTDVQTTKEPTTATTDEPTTADPTCSTPGQWCELRLPRHILPVHYDLYLFPNMYGENDDFSGDVDIWLNLLNATDIILVHIKYLTISETVVKRHDPDGTVTELKLAKDPWHFEYNQFWVIQLESEIAANSNISVGLSFNGSLSNGIVGFYKSTYINGDTGEVSEVASSKFEPVDARKAFPCLDEPDMKATFTISLKHNVSYTALSNMPIIDSVQQSDGLNITYYEKTNVVMSTYLVCFVVGKFDYKETITNYGKKFRVYATPDKINQVDYALASGVEILAFYEEKFGMNYSLPKLDMIAIPNFVSGAMEHWGLITYRETALLFDEAQASSSNQQRVLAVVAHELAHMWFGNIVTMKWWDDLWLNEGFASFMEWIGMDHFEKEWDLLLQPVIGDMQPVMPADASISSHPVVVDVERPESITQVFDAISYQKGSSLIRMLKDFMGDAAFFKGIQGYMRRFEYSNARTAQLWEVLGEEANRDDVTLVMRTWTEQMGFPVINVMNGSSQSTVKVQQKRFVGNADDQDEADKQPSEFNFTWRVPITYKRAGDDLVHQVWLNSSEEMELDVGVNTFVKFNTDQTGFYRVNYPPHMWRQLMIQLQDNHTVLSSADRAGLIDDGYRLANADLLSWETALDLLTYIYKERAYVPWHAAYRMILGLGSAISKTQHNSRWQTLMKNFTTDALTKYGYEDDGGHLSKRTRVDLLTISCRYGGEKCLIWAADHFNKWITNETYFIAPNFRSLVYRYGIANAGYEQWEIMWNRYKESLFPQEKIKLIYGLAHARQPWIVKLLLEYSKNPDNVLDQDFATVVDYASSNDIGLPVAWEWVRENYLDLVDRFGLESRQFGRVIPNLVSRFDTETRLKEVEAFYNEHPDAGAGSGARVSSIAAIKANISWNKKSLPKIVDWLEKNIGPINDA